MMIEEESPQDSGIVSMRRRRLVLALLVLVVMAGAVVVTLRLTRGPPYRVTFLPALGGVGTRAHSINDHGEVLATVRMAREGPRLVVWDKSDTVRQIDSLAAGCFLEGAALNNAGQVAGTVHEPNGACRAFLWDPTEGKIAVRPPDEAAAYVWGLNDIGQMVGVLKTAAGLQKAFVWDRHDGVRELATLGGPESRACSINGRGQIVGFSQTPDGRWHAAFWKRASRAYDLGLAPPKQWAKVHINNDCLVAGNFGSAADLTCISVWDAKTEPRRLPSLGGISTEVWALNDAGRLLVTTYVEGVKVAGRRILDDSRTYQWDRRRSFRRLSERVGRPDVRTLVAIDINKDGAMIGSLRLKRGPRTSYAVLLEPIK
jgi:probable HAF family extracellular repeat protein